MYTQEVIESLGGRQNVVDFSYHLPYIKAGIQGLMEGYSKDKKKKLEGIKKALLCLEEYIFFPGDDEFGGSSSISKLRKILKRNGFNDDLYNDFINNSNVDPNAEDAFNGVIFICNHLNSTLDGVNIIDGIVMGSTDPLMSICDALSQIINILNGSPRVDPDVLWKTTMSNYGFDF